MLGDDDFAALLKKNRAQTTAQFEGGFAQTSGMPAFADVQCDPQMHSAALRVFTTGETIDAMCPWWTGLSNLQASTPSSREFAHIWAHCCADTPAPTGAEFMLTWKCKGAPFFTILYRGHEVDCLLALQKGAASEATSDKARTIIFSHHTRKCYVAQDHAQLGPDDPPVLVQFLCNDDCSEPCMKVIDILYPRPSSPRSRVAALQALGMRWAESQRRNGGLSVMWCGDLTRTSITNLLQLPKVLKHTICSVILLTPDPLSQLHIPWEVVTNQEVAGRCPPPPAWYANLTARTNSSAPSTVHCRQGSLAASQLLPAPQRQQT